MYLIAGNIKWIRKACSEIIINNIYFHLEYFFYDYKQFTCILFVIFNKVQGYMTTNKVISKL